MAYACSSYLLDSLELSDFEMKCLNGLRLYIKKIDLISSHLTSPRLEALVVALGFCLVVHAHIDMTHVTL